MKKILLVILGLIAVLAATIFFYIQDKKSIRSGQLRLDGLTQQVRVDYDQWGIPHIRAQSMPDALTALGFVHAQERLFQMDLLRRVGHGRLAELLGESGVRVDQLFRTLGTHTYAMSQASKLRQEHPHIAELLLAYYQGVNQAIEQLSSPIEYDILRAKPEPFMLEDGFAIASYMAHSFAPGLSADPLMTAVQKAVSEEHLIELEWAWPLQQIQSNHTADLEVATLLRMQQSAQALLDELPLGQVHGSNAWAVNSSKTANGETLYANDPHMAFSVPAVWFEAQLSTSEHDVYGHFAAGIPFPLLMRTDFRVHGLTMLQNDDADLYAMPYSEDKKQVLYGGDWVNLTSITETIKVKGADSVNFEVIQSPLGPIVNEVLSINIGQAVALNWLFTHPDNHSVKTFYDLFYANDLASVQKAVSQHWAPGLNISYADAGDNIAMWAAGRFIQRPQGINGKTIIDGSKADNLPLGLHDFSHNPRIVNPESGYLFSTNNPYPDSDPAYAHAGYYSPIHRALTADQALSQESKWDIKKMQALQTSSNNFRWLSVKALINDVLSQAALTSLEQEAAELLSNWSGNYQAELAAASIFERFYYLLHQQVFADELGEDIFERFFNRPLADNSLFKLLNSEDALWWDNASTQVRESRRDILLNAFKLSVASLVEEFGPSSQNWQWQQNASLTHPHPLGRVKPMDSLFNVGEFAVLGSKRALNNMQFKFSDEKLIPTNGPSTRRIINLQNIRQAKNINPVGQSGRIFDQHYADQSQMYHANQYRDAIMFTDEDEGVTRLVLLPSGD